MEYVIGVGIGIAIFLLIGIMYQIGYGRGTIRAIADASKDYGEIVDKYREAACAFKAETEAYRKALAAAQKEMTIVWKGFCGQNHLLKTLGKRYSIPKIEALRLPVLPTSERDRITREFFKELTGNLAMEAYAQGVSIEEDENSEFIGVLLRTPLPENLKLPEEYEGLPVRVVSIGKIEPQ